MLQRHHNRLLDQKFIQKLRKWEVDPFDPSVLSLDDNDDMDVYFDDDDDFESDDADKDHDGTAKESKVRQESVNLAYGS